MTSFANLHKQKAHYPNDANTLPIISLQTLLLQINKSICIMHR